MERADFKLFKENHRTWIVVRINGEYDQHAHFESKNGGKWIIFLLTRGLKPRDEYFIEAARRLTTEEEFAKLKFTHNPKPKYYNHSKKNYGRKG